VTTSPTSANPPLTGPVEDYLKAIYDLERDAQPAATNDIAERLAISPASVSGMMRRLAEHQVGLQIEEQLFRLRSVIDEPLLDSRRESRQQQAVQLAQIRVARRVAQRGPLIQPPAHPPRRMVAESVGRI